MICLVQVSALGVGSDPLALPADTRIPVDLT